MVSLLQSSALVDELLLKDDKNPRNALLYRMALNSGKDGFGGLSSGLSQFKYFYLVSSCQDAFVPFHSERRNHSGHSGGEFGGGGCVPGNGYGLLAGIPKGGKQDGDQEVRRVLRRACGGRE